MPDNTSIAFLGTAAFAVPSLKIILDNNLNLVGVLTRPDRPAGRGRKVAVSPVKEMALEYGQKVYQPESKIDLENELLHIRPQLIVSVAYGMFLPTPVLAIPPLGAVNLHPSLLPAYRGPAPIQRALMAGEETTGVSIFFMTPQMDAGDLILQQSAGIDPLDSFGTLSHRLAPMGAQSLLEAIKLIISGEAPRIPQDDAQASYAPLITGDDEIIDWSRDDFSLVNQIRALEPAPGAYTNYRGKRLKIWRSVSETQAVQYGELSTHPGTICSVGKDYFLVSTAKNFLKVLELQPEGKKRMITGDFIKGYMPQAGERLA